MTTVEIVCGETSIIDLTKHEYLTLETGVLVLVQEVCSTRSVDEREPLVSDVCVDCQAEIFDEDYDDECGFDPYLGCYTDDC